MKVDGRPYRSLWREGRAVRVIDQTRLPHAFETVALRSADEVADAIVRMVVRGAPLIGISAAYGLALALDADAGDAALDRARNWLAATRPTAVNLRWALGELQRAVAPLPPAQRADAAWACADALAEDDVRTNASIGAHGARLLRERWEALGRPERLQVLTHCNAGWLACIDWGTALAALYQAHDAGVPLHVWVDETRPRNQGASLTTWELARHGVPCTLVADNAGGHLMRAGRVHACIVGADRVTAGGDVCNKIGTYLKALAAADNGVPFYVAMPLSTIDWTVSDGQREIQIEERSAAEVTHLWGRGDDGRTLRVQLAPDGTAAANPAFDVTPARLVTALVSERGVVPASAAGLAAWREPPR